MFTGLIESIGSIQKITRRGNYRVISITPEIPFENIEKGESIAVSGPCLTVVDFDDESFTVEASQETIAVTTLKDLRAGDRINLERALRADARLGGHFVSGHIDCTLEVKQVKNIGQSLQVAVDLPEQYAAYVVNRGSVALDGISLTVTKVDREDFYVNLIPETQKRTNWGEIKAGMKINVEFDLIGKYLLRFLEQKETSRLTIDLMKQMGY